jgi:hypothetical protein
VRLIYTALTWAGRTVASIVGGLILLVAATALLVGLVNQSPTRGVEAGARLGYAVVHYTVVAAGVVASFGDDVGPSFDSGRTLGDKQGDLQAPAPAAARGR